MSTSREMQVALRGMGEVRARRLAMSEEAARKWFVRNPGESAQDCARATGCPVGVAQRVRRTFGWPPASGRMFGDAA